MPITAPTRYRSRIVFFRGPVSFLLTRNSICLIITVRSNLYSYRLLNLMLISWRCQYIVPYLLYHCFLKFWLVQSWQRKTGIKFTIIDETGEAEKISASGIISYDIHSQNDFHSATCHCQVIGLNWFPVILVPHMCPAAAARWRSCSPLAPGNMCTHLSPFLNLPFSLFVYPYWSNVI